jgi:hypothetical protein
MVQIKKVTWWCTVSTLAWGHPVNAALFGVGDDWTLGADTWQNATQLDGIKVSTVAALCASGHCE